jgi:hypothetical protein
MKTISFLFIIFVACTCKAQTINIKDVTGDYTEGAYYKDIDNVLDNFTGTYIYTNGTTSLKFVLQKKINTLTSSDGINYHEDILIGEYQYIKDGVQIANTLASLNINMISAYNYSINGNTILIGNVYGCDDCGPNEIQLRMGIVDHATKSLAQLMLRKKIVNSQQALEINIWWQMKVRHEDEPVVHAPFPGGDYVMIKQ